MKWRTLQSKVHGLNLNDLIDEECLLIPVDNEVGFNTISVDIDNYSDSNISNAINNALLKIKEAIYVAVDKIVPNEPSINELIMDVKDSCDVVESILENFIELYRDEYYYFTSIKSMLFYILDDKDLLSNLSNFKELISSFFNLIQLKFNSPNKYQLKQEEFELELDNYEQIFYTMICKPSENYNEKVLSDITNSLLNI